MILKSSAVPSITLSLLLIFQLSKAAPPIAKSNCQDHCGKTPIPYPFGIGDDCYMNKSFKVECNQTSSSSSPRAYISSINMEVLDIERGKAFVKGPVIPFNCSGKEASSTISMNFKGSPFFFSVDSIFATVGCNTRSRLTDIGPLIIGCESTCKNESYVEDGLINHFCYGKNCCQVSVMPYQIQVFKPSLETNSPKEDSNGCQLTFAFMADSSSWDGSIIRDPQQMQNLEFFRVGLSWNMDDLWTFDARVMTCDFHFYASSGKINGYQCFCDNGYEGNPYLGCIDVDECRDPKQNSCRRFRKCVNLPGSYKCEVRRYWIIVLVLGAVAALSTLLIGAFWLHKYINKRNDIEHKRRFFERNGGLLLQQQLSACDGSVQKTKVFSSQELEKATDHFNENRILGQGGQGTVYKGMLADGRIVAVKRPKIMEEKRVEEFINELVILSQIDHRNVVKVLGCCLETKVPLLVYEFIPNGTLFRYIHHQKEELISLTWDTRLRFATEVAGALSYLHSSASVPIYHRDIKSTNILLDEKFRAKVSDFGTSRLIAIDQTHLTTNVAGTFGYLDPEYFQSSQFTDKSDVYSFGVVLVELLSGEKPIFWTPGIQEARGLADHFLSLMQKDKLFDILDPEIKEHCQVQEVTAVANLAKKCLSISGKNRPTMKEVTVELERIELSKERSIAQENYEENEYDRTKETRTRAATPTSFTTDFDSVETEASSGFGTF